MPASAPKAKQPNAPAAADHAAAPQSRRVVPEFANNRPRAAAHRQQQARISSSPRMQQAAAGPARIGQSPRQQAAQRQAVVAPAPAARAAQAASAPTNNTGLPDELKAGVENLSGYTLDEVQVHYNSARPAQLQAHAYAQGTAIHLAPGQERHLPHEAWHVVQQKQGRVKPTRQLTGKVAVNDDAGLEKEADVMGAIASRLPAQRASKPLQQQAASAVVQRAGDFTGLVLPHETQPGAPQYTLGGKTHERDGAGTHQLTYHHIIPEGKLLRLGDMITRFEYLYGEKNAHSDKLNALKAEYAAVDSEVGRLTAAIRKGNEAAQKIEGLTRRQDPLAAQKAQDRGWNDEVAEGNKADQTLKAQQNELQAKKAEVEQHLKSLRLSDEEQEIMDGKADEIAAAELKPARKGSGGKSRNEFLKAQIHKLVASSRAQVQAVKQAEVIRMHASDNPNEKARASKFESQDIRESFSNEYSASLGFGGTAWIPGNIHEGPSSRISKNDVGFDANVDDGGSEFETSAKHIIPEAQFNLLQQLSINLNLFKQDGGDRFDRDRMDKFIDIIQRINEIRENYPVLKQFDVENWDQVTEGLVRENLGGVQPLNKQPTSKKAAIRPKNV